VARTITLSEEVYGALKRYKRSRESFSQTIFRFTEKADRRNLLSLAGAWGDMSCAEEEELVGEIRRAWRGWRA